MNSEFLTPARCQDVGNVGRLKHSASFTDNVAGACSRKTFVIVFDANCGA